MATVTAVVPALERVADGAFEKHAGDIEHLLKAAQIIEIVSATVELGYAPPLPPWRITVPEI